MRKACFISFEGGDGSGKSTQIRLLCQRLSAMGIPFFLTREPGGSPLGSDIRALLLDPEKQISPRTEALLYAADRAQHMEQVILPALAVGKVVISDRFSDSTLAYQGFGRGLDMDMLQQLNDLAVAGRYPDRTIVLDIDPELGIRRAAAAKDGQKDRIEQERLDFHRRLREGYRSLAAAEPARFRLLDASKEKEEVAADVWAAIADLFEEKEACR